MLEGSVKGILVLEISHTENLLTVRAVETCALICRRVVFYLSTAESNTFSGCGGKWLCSEAALNFSNREPRCRSQSNGEHEFAFAFSFQKISRVPRQELLASKHMVR